MKKSIYSEAFIAHLFDQMSSSYRRMNAIASLGFYPLWRRQAIRKIGLKPGDCVADLLTGAGDCWKPILKKIGVSGQLTALDFSEGMLQQAKLRKQRYSRYDIRIVEESIFHNSIPSSSQDAVICAYGIKTFTPEQLAVFVNEVHRILKPGGHFSLVDVSLPPQQWLRALYLFYIARVIPFLASVFAADGESYKMLGVYARHFKDSRHALPFFREKGFSVTYCNYFLGCATGIYGKCL